MDILYAQADTYYFSPILGHVYGWRWLTQTLGHRPFLSQSASAISTALTRKYSVITWQRDKLAVALTLSPPYQYFLLVYGGGVFIAPRV